MEPPDRTADEPAFEGQRGRLVGLAYRMLGSVAEAEDAVQDAWFRWRDADRAAVRNPGSYLSAVVTRLCLDRLKAARRRREVYVGPWLPEPLLDDPALAVLPAEETAQDVSIALMLALERLSPLERAAFILHDVFDMGFGEIAVALGRNEAACRQLASRARAQVQRAKPRFAVEAKEGARVAAAFFAASRGGDLAALRDLLSDSATLYSDGGGLRPAALRPIAGGDRISRFFAGLSRKGKLTAPLWSKRLALNGLPGLATVEADGTLQTVALDIAGGRVVTVYITRNPDKLRHIASLLPEGIADSAIR